MRSLVCVCVCDLKRDTQTEEVLGEFVTLMVMLTLAHKHTGPTNQRDKWLDVNIVESQVVFLLVYLLHFSFSGSQSTSLSVFFLPISHCFSFSLNLYLFPFSPSQQYSLFFSLSTSHFFSPPLSRFSRHPSPSPPQDLNSSSLLFSLVLHHIPLASFPSSLSLILTSQTQNLYLSASRHTPSFPREDYGHYTHFPLSAPFLYTLSIPSLHDPIYPLLGS